MLLQSAHHAVPRMRSAAPAGATHGTQSDAVRLVGELMENATASCSAAGHAFVSVVLRQPGGLPPVHVVRCFGQGAAAQMASHSAADRLRKGHTVSAWGAAIGPAHNFGARGAPHLELVGCTGLVEHLPIEDEDL